MSKPARGSSNEFRPRHAPLILATWKNKILTYAPFAPAHQAEPVPLDPGHPSPFAGPIFATQLASIANKALKRRQKKFSPKFMQNTLQKWRSIFSEFRAKYMEGIDCACFDEFPRVKEICNLETVVTAHFKERRRTREGEIIAIEDNPNAEKPPKADEEEEEEEEEEEVIDSGDGKTFFQKPDDEPSSPLRSSPELSQSVPNLDAPNGQSNPRKRVLSKVSPVFAMRNRQSQDQQTPPKLPVSTAHRARTPSPALFSPPTSTRRPRRSVPAPDPRKWQLSNRLSPGPVSQRQLSLRPVASPKRIDEDTAQDIGAGSHLVSPAELLYKPAQSVTPPRGARKRRRTSAGRLPNLTSKCKRRIGAKASAQQPLTLVPPPDRLDFQKNHSLPDSIPATNPKTVPLGLKGRLKPVPNGKPSPIPENKTNTKDLTEIDTIIPRNRSVYTPDARQDNKRSCRKRQRVRNIVLDPPTKMLDEKGGSASPLSSPPSPDSAEVIILSSSEKSGPSEVKSRLDCTQEAVCKSHKAASAETPQFTGKSPALYHVGNKKWSVASDVLLREKGPSKRMVASNADDTNPGRNELRCSATESTAKEVHVPRARAPNNILESENRSPSCGKISLCATDEMPPHQLPTAVPGRKSLVSRDCQGEVRKASGVRTAEESSSFTTSRKRRARSLFEDEEIIPECSASNTKKAFIDLLDGWDSLKQSKNMYLSSLFVEESPLVTKQESKSLMANRRQPRCPSGNITSAWQQRGMFSDQLVAPIEERVCPARDATESRGKEISDCKWKDSGVEGWISADRSPSTNVEAPVIQFGKKERGTETNQEASSPKQIDNGTVELEMGNSDGVLDIFMSRTSPSKPFNDSALVDIDSFMAEGQYGKQAEISCVEKHGNSSGELSGKKMGVCPSEQLPTTASMQESDILNSDNISTAVPQQLERVSFDTVENDQTKNIDVKGQESTTKGIAAGACNGEGRTGQETPPFHGRSIEIANCEDQPLAQEAVGAPENHTVDVVNGNSGIGAGLSGPTWTLNASANPEATDSKVDSNSHGSCKLPDCETSEQRTASELGPMLPSRGPPSKLTESVMTWDKDDLEKLRDIARLLGIEVHMNSNSVTKPVIVSGDVLSQGTRSGVSCSERGSTCAKVRKELPSAQSAEMRRATEKERARRLLSTLHSVATLQRGQS